MILVFVTRYDKNLGRRVSFSDDDDGGDAVMHMLNKKKCKVRRSSKSFTTCDPWGIFISLLDYGKRIENKWKGILNGLKFSGF